VREILKDSRERVKKEEQGEEGIEIGEEGTREGRVEESGKREKRNGI